MVALSLSADAFAVSVCKGLSLKRIKLSHCLIVGLYFGVFQAAMPLIGYLIASTVASRISEFSFYIAFGLLFLIGLNMIREALSGDDSCPADTSLSPKAMIPLAIATSIDALAVGVSFALISVSIIPAVSIIGAVTLTVCAAGVRIGSFVGEKFHKIAGVIGGSVLVIMGIKILLEGLGVI